MKTGAKKQSPTKILLTTVDAFQRKHTFFSLPYGIFKKFSEDEGGHLAALMTYYGFLSLFPLLIVAIALAQIISQGNAELKDRIVSSVTSYFPAIGDSLAANLHAPSRTGIALVIGLLIIFYGARGVADSVQNALHVVWAVPRKKRAGFPKSMLRSFSILLFGGIGLVGSALLSGYATSASFPFVAKIGVGTASFIVLFAVFWGIFTYGSSARKRPIANIPGALIAAVGLQFLQAIGTYLINSQLRNHSGLNAQFAVILALFFWIYLQAQVFIFALEYNTVRAHRLYPRALDESDPTDADKRAHSLYASRDSYSPPEK